MRIYFYIIVLIIINFNVRGQIFIDSRDEIDDILNLQSQPYDNGVYYVQTTYNKLNHSSMLLQEFLKLKLGLSQYNDEEFNLKKGYGTIKYTYIQGIINSFNDIDEDAYKVYLNYKVFPLENNFFVEDMDIWGNWEHVANIFILYYPTSINLEHLKNNKTEIVSYFLSDRAVFSTEFVNGRLQGRIKIRNTKYDNTESFLNEFKIKKEVFNQKIQEELEKKIQEENKIKTTTYSIKNISENNFLFISRNIINVLSNIYSFKDNLNISGNIIINFDLEGNKKIYYHYDNYNSLPKNITEKISSFNIEPPKINSYFVKTADTFFYELNFQTDTFVVKKTKKGIKYYEDLPFDTKLKVNNYLNKFNEDKYTLAFNYLEFNKTKSYNISIINSKNQSNKKQTKEKKKFSSEDNTVYLVLLIGTIGYILYYLFLE